jgi:hypothetical protein
MRDQRLPVVGPLPQPEDDGGVADDDRQEGENELSDGREESVDNPKQENILNLHMTIHEPGQKTWGEGRG